jgi:hypothetical protein
MIDKIRVTPILSPLLQKGVFMKVVVGSSIRELLQDQLGITRDFVDGRISTVFLNGKAVDNIDSAIVRDNSEIALSGAMPGFVGATMRRGGYYSSMRSAISHIEENPVSVSGEGLIRIKLYNTLIDSLGELFAVRGFFIQEMDLSDLKGTRIEPFLTTTRYEQFPDLVLVKVVVTRD